MDCATSPSIFGSLAACPADNCVLVRETRLVETANRADEALTLERLVLLMLVGDGPMDFRLADSAALHATIVQASFDGSLAAVIQRLGHRPDPMIGRRITGLDDALRELADVGTLIPITDMRWRAALGAEALARCELAALPMETRTLVRDLARHWRKLTNREAARRGAPLQGHGVA